MANLNKDQRASSISIVASKIADVPDAPTIGAATNVGTSRAFNNGSATVAFTANARGGTSTSFTATSTPGSFTASGAGSPLTVTGLQSATSYTFAVTGTNASATGPASSASSSITATTVPQAPTIGTASVATGQSYTGSANASVTFTPGQTGGATASYTVTSSSGNTGTGSSSPISVSDTVGTARTYTVTATNANGTTAASSASNSVTPASVPQAPTIGAATAGNATATVAYTANATGGAAVSTYTATSSPGGLTGTGASPITVSGLTNGTAYTFTVTATNANGTSAASSASSSVTPVSPYWVEYMNGPTGYGLTNSGGYVYTFSSGSSTDAYWRKIDSTGAITSQYSWTRPSGTVFYYNRTGVYDAAQSRTVLVGYYKESSSAVYKPAIIGINSSNAQVYAIYNTGDSGYTQPIIAADYGNGYVWGVGYVVNTSAETRAFAICYNNGSVTSGIVWGAATGGAAKAVAVTTGGTAYVGGSEYNFGYYPSVTKITTGGTITWNASLNYTNQPQIFCVAAYSDTSNPTCAGWTGTSGTEYTIAALNYSTAAIVWQRKLSGLSSIDTEPSICMDSSGNTYFLARGYVGANYCTIIVKYNSSGTLQWQRTFRSPNNYNFSKITTDGTSVFAGQVNATELMRYPCDGSITGTYTYRGYSFYIEASSITEAAGGLTKSTLGTSVTVIYTSTSTIGTGTIAATSDAVSGKISI